MTFPPEIVSDQATAMRPPRTPEVKLLYPKSAVTNGSRLFLDETIDYRTREARRFRDILSEILSDIGPENLTEGQRQVARRLSLMCLQAELLEADAVAGKEIDVEKFSQLSERISRIFVRLPDIKRTLRNVTATTLEDYAKEVAQ